MFRGIETGGFRTRNNSSLANSVVYRIRFHRIRFGSSQPPIASESHGNCQIRLQSRIPPMVGFT
ncbi:unnamed protein product [Clonostachys chloroleuca]|uniref:Uncharacterized protein n=1 Tax=Clonostachys chloroleuca TaxID=1926264 RepID=A0AA35M9W4_9HYPO|nr:unnamed protein product [Clonostachys chloroleuca]